MSYFRVIGDLLSKNIISNELFESTFKSELALERKKRVELLLLVSESIYNNTSVKSLQLNGLIYTGFPFKLVHDTHNNELKLVETYSGQEIHLVNMTTEDYFNDRKFIEIIDDNFNSISDNLIIDINNLRVAFEQNVVEINNLFRGTWYNIAKNLEPLNDTILALGNKEEDKVLLNFSPEFDVSKRSVVTKFKVNSDVKYITIWDSTSYFYALYVKYKETNDENYKSDLILDIISKIIKPTLEKFEDYLSEILHKNVLLSIGENIPFTVKVDSLLEGSIYEPLVRKGKNRHFEPILYVNPYKLNFKTIVNGIKLMVKYDNKINIDFDGGNYYDIFENKISFDISEDKAEKFLKEKSDMLEHFNKYTKYTISEMLALKDVSDPYRKHGIYVSIVHYDEYKGYKLYKLIYRNKITNRKVYLYFKDNNLISSRQYHKIIRKKLAQQ